jgi:SET domain-containing protein
MLGRVHTKQAVRSIMKITVRVSPIHGLGVFALQDVAAGETLELCPYIVIDDDDLQEANRLNDYLFTSPDDPNDYLVVMGCGMLYNHATPGNAKWEVDETDNRFLRFYADCDIKAGEELFHDYGEEYWTTRAEE